MAGQVSDNLKQYQNKKLELHIIDECLFYGHRVVIPKSLQKAVLEELHTTHEGIVRMKRRARTKIWFPEIDKQIELIAKSCNACLKTRQDPPKTCISWPKANEPFHTVHIDFFFSKTKNT